MRTVHFFATYYEQEKSAVTLIQSLLMQTADNWKLTICSNADNTLLNVKEQWGFDPRITFIVKEKNSGFWGAPNRKWFINEVLEDDELIVNTSAEDYYAPKTVEFINSREEDFIMWDFTHHQFNYDVFHCISQPRVRKIDWGNYALLGKYAKQVDMQPIPRKNEQGEEYMENPWESFFGDGYFVEYLFRQHPEITNIRLPKVLFVKN
jgi:hypothetical protein